MDHHERQAFWQQQVKQHHSSGLSARQFTQAQHEPSQPGFAKVKQSATIGRLSSQELYINLPDGIRITGIGHDNLGVLLSMLRQL